MLNYDELDAFVQPNSIAVIGASERPGSWGAYIMQGILSRDYNGKVYPINPSAKKIFGVPAFKDIREIDKSVELAILAVPAESVEQVVIACGQKGVKGLIMITAGFAETSENGKAEQNILTKTAHSYGMRILGPNVSGAFNLRHGFYAAYLPIKDLVSSPLAGICQGGYAVYDIMTSASSVGMGLGKFIHTGNESDLTVTDFLDRFRHNPEVEGVVMYLETLRDGGRFIEIARDFTIEKPLVVYKGGRTSGSKRAAQSHTGAMSGDWALFQGLLKQAGVVLSPTIELLLPLGHALIERPPMKGAQVGIVTIGGSWGVILSDFIEEARLFVPELSMSLQNEIRALGIPERASIKNPVDMGASGLSMNEDLMLEVGRKILLSGEVNALVLHGIGSPGLLSKHISDEQRSVIEAEKSIIRKFHALEKEFGLPVLIGCHHTQWESRVVWELNKEGIKMYNRTDEISQILFAIYRYWLKSRA